MKYLSQHINKKNFFRELKEDEIFMYSYHDYKWEDVVAFAEEYKVKIDSLQKGSEEYKKYGECAAKVVNIKTTIFSYKTNSHELIEIESPSEELAKLKLINILLDQGIVKLVEVRKK